MTGKKEKKFKNLLGFIVSIKLITTTEGGKGGKSKRIYRTNKKIRIINAFLESLLSGSCPSLGVTVHLTFLGCPPTLCYLGPAVGAAQILIWSCSCVFLPPMSTAIRSVCSLFWELSMTFDTSHSHSLPTWSCGCKLQLVELVGRFWVIFLSHSALGFNCGFISTSTCGSSTGVCSCEGQVRRRCTCLGRRGSGSTRYSGELAARAAGNIVR